MKKYKEDNIDIDILKNKDSIVQYKGYYIDKNGDVYNKYGHKMARKKNKVGTWIVLLRIDGTRKSFTVNRLLYEAFHQDKDIGYCRVISLLDNDYEIKNGISNEPIFNLDDLIVVPIIKGGNPQTNEYRQTRIRNKKDIINKRHELMENYDENIDAINILNWVLGE